jgi:hypothetical protein
MCVERTLGSILLNHSTQKYKKSGNNIPPPYQIYTIYFELTLQCITMNLNIPMLVFFSHKHFFQD